jgi:hypothetical protein
MSVRQDYLKHGWGKCGMGRVGDPEFQKIAFKEVIERKLFSDEIIAKYAEEVLRIRREEDNIVQDNEDDADLTPEEIMDNIMKDKQNYLPEEVSSDEEGSEYEDAAEVESSGVNLFV